MARIRNRKQQNYKRAVLLLILLVISLFFLFKMDVLIEKIFQ